MENSFAEMEVWGRRRADIAFPAFLLPAGSPKPTRTCLLGARAASRFPGRGSGRQERGPHGPALPGEGVSQGSPVWVTLGGCSLEEEGGLEKSHENSPWWTRAPAPSIRAGGTILLVPQAASVAALASYSSGIPRRTSNRGSWT